MRCLLLLVTSLALTAAGEMPLTVAKLTDFIKSAVSLKQPDKQVADTLRHFKMTEKLDDRAIEELQSLGAGPKTVAALKELGDASASLPEAAPPPPAPVVVPIPPPDSVEQAKVIDEAREYVENYTKSLPNFICVQVTRRDVDRAGTGTSWYHMDTITARLSYNGQHEDYEVILKDNQPVNNVKMEQLGGTVSAGEFGTMMSDIFDPRSQAQFSWDHWATLRGRRNYVFAYDIAQEYSQYHVKEVETNQEIVPAYRGLIYVDRDTKTLTKITLNPYNIPTGFPIHEIHESLDYDFQTIGDSQYMLPLKAVLTSKLARYGTRNDIEFRLYRKFETGSTIKFDTPDPLPEDQTKEK
ncbi:MAG: hypothetical protein ACLPWF_04060 [Bryobacteraceae bacterium]|jgi:hypothetical protein